MKNEKQRFFALYWGQEVCQTKGGRYEIDENCFPLWGKSYLELKPLSKLSDDDAIEIGKFVDSKSNKFINVNYSFSEKKKLPYIKSVISDKGRFDIIDNFSLLIEDKIINFSLDIFDYLRSKGYAVPFMEYSVENLVEMGWIKLK
jgi:hypothetical protein